MIFYGKDNSLQLKKETTEINHNKHLMRKPKKTLQNQERKQCLLYKVESIIRFAEKNILSLH